MCAFEGEKMVCGKEKVFGIVFPFAVGLRIQRGKVEEN